MEYPQVVRVFATSQEPDYSSPWRSRAPTRGTGSGVVIGKNRILTGAHVVANATFVQIQKHSDTDKYITVVERICHDADLAILSVKDPNALSDIPLAEIGELPALRDKVSVVGFPVGGEEISITEGVVSRVEVQRYAHSDRHLLAVTVDAAINSGNSGGPVFSGDKVVGIAFQSLEEAENVGEMVPVPVINQFVNGLEKGKPSAIPGLGISTQVLENPAHRKHVGLESKEKGVLVTSVSPKGSSYGVLQVGDILCGIGGQSIANNGTVQYRGKYRTRYDVGLIHHYIGDAMELEIKRAGKRKNVTVTLQPLPQLVSRPQYETAPRYFVYAGLVFQVLTVDFLSVWDTWWERAPKELLYLYHHGELTETQEEVIVLTDVLGDEINAGYEDLYNETITSVNGHAPLNLQDFVQKVESSKDIVEFVCSSHGRIVINASEVDEANKRIQKIYGYDLDRNL